MKLVLKKNAILNPAHILMKRGIIEGEVGMKYSDHQTGDKNSKTRSDRMESKRFCVPE